MSLKENLIHTPTIPSPTSNRVTRRAERPGPQPLRSLVPRNTINPRVGFIGDSISEPLDSQTSGVIPNPPATSNRGRLERSRHHSVPRNVSPRTNFIGDSIADSLESQTSGVIPIPPTTSNRGRSERPGRHPFIPQNINARTNVIGDTILEPLDSQTSGVIPTPAITPPTSNRVSRRSERPGRHPLVPRNINARSNFISNPISDPIGSQRTGSDFTDSLTTSNSLPYPIRVHLPNLSGEKDPPMISHRAHTLSSPLPIVASVLSHRAHNFSLVQVLLMLVYIGAIFYASFCKSDPLTDTYRAGWVITSQLPFLCGILATKSNNIDRMIDVGYEKLNFLRRLFGRLLIDSKIHSLDNVYQRSFGIIPEKITEHFVRGAIVFVKYVVLIACLFTACYYAPGCIPCMIVVCGLYDLDHEFMITRMGMRNLSDLHRFIMENCRQMLESMVMMFKKTGRWLLGTTKTSLYGEIGKDAGRNTTLGLGASHDGAGHSEVTFVVGGSDIAFTLSVVQVLIQASGANHVKVVMERAQDPVTLLETTLFRVHIFNSSAISGRFDGMCLARSNALLSGIPQITDTRFALPSIADVSQRPEGLAPMNPGRVGAVDSLATAARPSLLTPLAALGNIPAEVPSLLPSAANCVPQAPEGTALMRRNCGHVGTIDSPQTMTRLRPLADLGTTRTEMSSRLNANRHTGVRRRVRSLSMGSPRSAASTSTFANVSPMTRGMVSTTERWTGSVSTMAQASSYDEVTVMSPGNHAHVQHSAMSLHSLATISSSYVQCTKKHRSDEEARVDALSAVDKTLNDNESLLLRSKRRHGDDEDTHSIL